MESRSDFELNLGQLACYETTQKDDGFKKKFVPYAIRVLATHSTYLTSFDLLERKDFQGLCIDEILEQYPNIQFAGYVKNPDNEDHLLEIYFDLFNDFPIEKDHIFYDRFFACQIKHLSLLRIDAFLDYQFQRHYDNNLQAFSRFLHLVIRKHKTDIISEDSALTIQEWIVFTEKKVQNESEQSRDLLKIKIRDIKRTDRDNTTVLNRDQIVLLLHFFRQSRVFLKDENLNDADAGKAFHILTGYSHNTLRQELGKYYQLNTRENVEKIRIVVTQILRDMEQTIRKSA